MRPKRTLFDLVESSSPRWDWYKRCDRAGETSGRLVQLCYTQGRHDFIVSARLVLLLKSGKNYNHSKAILLVRCDGLLSPGSRKFDMFRSEEEKINIVIGEAILALLEDDGVFSAYTLSRQLKQMLELETEAARREIIREAIRQTSRLLATALYSGNSSAEVKRLSREFSCQQNIGY